MVDLLRVAAGQEATPSGRVRLALPEGLASNWLLRRLPDFHTRFPEVELDLTIGPAVVDLLRGASEVALRFVPAEASDLVEVPSASCTSRPTREGCSSDRRSMRCGGSCSSTPTARFRRPTGSSSVSSRSAA